jgi:hypothetical protein
VVQDNKPSYCKLTADRKRTEVDSTDKNKAPFPATVYLMISYACSSLNQNIRFPSASQESSDEASVAGDPGNDQLRFFKSFFFFCFEGKILLLMITHCQPY